MLTAQRSTLVSNLVQGVHGTGIPGISGIIRKFFVSGKYAGNIREFRPRYGNFCFWPYCVTRWRKLYLETIFFCLIRITTRLLSKDEIFRYQVFILQTNYFRKYIFVSTWDGWKIRKKQQKMVTCASALGRHNKTGQKRLYCCCLSCLLFLIS